MSNFLNNVTIAGTLSTSSSISGTKFYGDGSSLSNIISALPTTATNFTTISTVNLSATNAYLSSLSATNFYGNGINLTNVVTAIPTTVTNFITLSTVTLSSSNEYVKNNLTVYGSISAPTITAPSISATYLYGDGSSLLNLPQQVYTLVTATSTIKPIIPSNNDGQGKYNVITGGSNNSVAGVGSTVAGGVSNQIYNSNNTTLSGGSTIGGGFSNTANNPSYSNYGITVAGGACNNAIGNYSSIIGGIKNTISNGGDCSSILGGQNNSTNQANTFLIGNGLNVTSNPNFTYVNNLSAQCYIYGNGLYITNVQSSIPYCVNSGNNSILAYYGGNTNSGTASVVSGGQGNSVSNNFSSIGGGCQNVSSGFGSRVGGGLGNQAVSYFTIVAGGSANCANATSDTVVGGTNNNTTGYWSFIGGGSGNIIGSSSNYSSIVAGSTNTIVGGGGSTASSIVNGANNIVNSSYSSILGGQYNFTNGQSNVFLLGTGLSANNPSYTYVNNLSSQGYVYANKFIGDGSQLTGLPYNANVNAQNNATSYTIQLSDNGGIITSTNTTTGLTALVSNSISYPTGFTVQFLQLANSNIYLSGTTINNAYGYSKTSRQYASATLLYTGSSWVSFGDMTTA